jgi:hypothetical protein
VKVWGVKHSPNARATKLRGSFLVVKDKKRGWRVQAWPKKRGHYQSERQRVWGEWFKAVNGYLAAPDAAAYLWAKNLTDNTIFMPRDLLLKMSAGRFWQIDFKDGTQLWSYALMADQGQALLDAVTTTPGAMLYRAPDGWRGLMPGLNGQLLATSPDAGKVQWVNPPSGGGGSGWQAMQVDGPDSGAYSTKGLRFTPIMDVSISKVGFYVSALAGQTYVCRIYRNTNPRWSVPVINSDPVAITASGAQMVIFDLPGPALLTAGLDYIIALSITSAGNAFANQLWRGEGRFANLPVAASVQGVETPNAVPLSGDTTFFTTFLYNTMPFIEIK